MSYPQFQGHSLFLELLLVPVNCIITSVVTAIRLTYPEL